MTPREQFADAMRQAAVYHGDEGTSGWLLSEDRFAAILAAADEYRASGLRELAAELEILSAGRDDQSLHTPGLEDSQSAQVASVAYARAARMARERAVNVAASVPAHSEGDGQQETLPGAPEPSQARGWDQ